MNEDPTLIDTLFKRVSEFSITYIELLKLKAINKSTEVVSSVLPDLVVSILLFVFLLFINLGVAFWIGDLLGRMYQGFLIVAAFYFLLGFIFHFFMRGWLKKATADYFVKRIFKEN